APEDLDGRVHRRHDPPRGLAASVAALVGGRWRRALARAHLRRRTGAGRMLHVRAGVPGLEPRRRSGRRAHAHGALRAGRQLAHAALTATPTAPTAPTAPA